LGWSWLTIIPKRRQKEAGMQQYLQLKLLPFNPGLSPMISNVFSPK
jgi:hypothetical protein